MPDEREQKQQPTEPVAQAPEKASETEDVSTAPIPAAPASGRRSSLSALRRQLSDEELKQTGVQKLLIEGWERAETECELLRVDVGKYHEADKEVARLTEKLRVNVALEIITAAGFAGGGAIVSIAPSIWDPKVGFKGIAAICVGALFIIGAMVAKVVQVRR